MRTCEGGSVYLHENHVSDITARRAPQVTHELDETRLAAPRLPHYDHWNVASETRDYDHRNVASETHDYNHWNVACETRDYDHRNVASETRDYDHRNVASETHDYDH